MIDPVVEFLVIDGEEKEEDAYSELGEFDS